MNAPSENVRAALAFVPAHDRDLWLRMGMAVKSELGDDGFEPWDEWSKQAGSYNAVDARDVWRSIEGDGGVTIGTLYHEARRHGFKPSGDARPTSPSAEKIAEPERKQSESDAERERLQFKARDRTTELLNVSGDPATHPYALMKRVPLGQRVKRGLWPQRGWTDALLVPIYQPDGRVWTIEAINVDGERNSLRDGRKRGGFHPFGTIIGASKVLIAEGIANAVVGTESDGSPAVATMSAGNLAAVASWVREVAGPGAELVFLADNDVRDDGTPNTGVEAAMAAAALVGGRVVIPEMDGMKCDFWDVWSERGPEAVKRALAGARAPQVATPAPATPARAAVVLEGRDWPQPLATEAMYGLAGEIMRAIEPDTESDPAAVLLQTLVAFGALVARGPHVRVEGDEHHTNLFLLIVGGTSKGRKGTSWGRVRQLFGRIASWKPTVSGLSSGEGLKFNVRDPVPRDPGVTDKRLLVIESEFAQALRVAARPGNTLSATVREAWDTGRLETLTKNDPITATGAHICIIGHITVDELRAELTATDTASGFANRFLFVGARRSKVLPFGGANMSDDVAASFAQRLERAAGVAQTRGALAMTPAAREVWTRIYPALSEGHTGLLGAATARAEAQCIRLALIYALLDEATAIDEPHLLAALAVWEYCDATARHVFGASLGDRIADEIMRALKVAGLAGLSRTEIRDLFKRHQTTERIGQALELLTQRKLVCVEQRQTGGRPEEIWTMKGATQAT